MEYTDMQVFTLCVVSFFMGMVVLLIAILILNLWDE